MTYVRRHQPDDDLWCYDELDDERWPVRHIEVHARDGAFAAAASLAEVIAARESGGAAAVSAYERQFGIVPETPFPAVAGEDEPPMEPVTADDFERLWQEARRVRSNGPGVSW